MCVMKLNKYFMMGAMGLSLVACSDNLDENGTRVRMGMPRMRGQRMLRLQ